MDFLNDMTVIFDAWRQIGRFRFAQKRLNAYFDRSSSCGRMCLHHTSDGEDKGGCMKSVSGTFADEQQEDVAKSHRLEGAAKPPNTGKASLEMMWEDVFSTFFNKRKDLRKKTANAVCFSENKFNIKN